MFGSLATALRGEGLSEAEQLIQRKISSGGLRAAVLHVRSGDRVLSSAFGQARTAGSVFLLASITKPMTATAVMILSDRAKLSLSDPARKFIPEFRGGDRERITIRHLLTHTSGLPDMLPENEELRKRHAPLKDFVAGACRTPLLFTPGTKVSYQSMGILLAAEIVERVANRPLPDFLRDEIFLPLGMKSTSLGLGTRKLADTMPSDIEGRSDWDWNSPYWRNLAAPWGGAFSTAADVERFLRYFVKPDPPILKKATAAAMIANQNRGLNQPWGIGWRLGTSLAQGTSARTFGHSGSTGTLAWLDPERDLSFVLLTTKPAAVSQKTVIKPVSDSVSGAHRK
jgi:CubicO group peptidase (beta-lactamase class C family)